MDKDLDFKTARYKYCLMFKVVLSKPDTAV